jgi:hypothetical protein
LSDFTILIQGPIHKHGLYAIRNYRQYGPVVISAYLKDEDQIRQYLRLNCQGDKDVFAIFEDDNISGFANFANQGKQAITTYNGLTCCKTDFVIKVRSEEQYTNLKPIIDSVKRYPLSWTSHNIWFKKVEKEWLHPGDHLIAGNTCLLREAFKKVKDWAYSLGDNQQQWLGGQIGINNCPTRDNKLFPENIFFVAFLMAKYHNTFEQYLQLTPPRQIMIENSALVNINDLSPYIWSFINLEGIREFLTTSDVAFNWPDSPAIQSMEEV